MKFGGLVAGVLSLAFAQSLTGPSVAGTLNGTEFKGAKYATSACKAPTAPGLSIRTMKSRAAFTKAAQAHNEFTAAIEEYQKCRVTEIGADQQIMLDQTKADIQALVDVSTAEANDLNAKNKELSK